MRILITGATAGIGREAALQLAADGHDLILVGRSADKLEAVAGEVTAAGAPAVATFVADFARLDTVRTLAAALRERYDGIDVLVNNAGGVFAKRTVTQDGFEATVQVNYLASYLLTDLLGDLVRARIVNTASVGHVNGAISMSPDGHFEDLGFERGYQIMRAYARSKLLMVLWTRHLAAQRPTPMVNALHPGAVSTDIWAGAPWFAKPVLAIWKRFMRSPAQGGATLVHLAVGRDVEHVTGAYFDEMTQKEPADLARNDALAAKVDAETRRLLGLDGSA